MSTSTTSSNRFSLVENWDTETLIIFLRDLDINLDEDDFKILRKQKIDGQIFPDMTERKFMKDGIKRGPAMKLEKQAKILKEGTRAFEKGKIEYFWLFPCGVWSLQHFISWSTNMFGPTEKNEAHTVRAPIGSVRYRVGQYQYRTELSVSVIGKLPKFRFRFSTKTETDGKYRLPISVYRFL